MSQINDTREVDEVVDLEEQEFLAQLGRDEEVLEQKEHEKAEIMFAMERGANPLNYN